PGHRDAARRMRALVAAVEAKRDLISLGAYVKGTDAQLDEAITRIAQIEAFLQQDPSERAPFEETVRGMELAVR
ncbi:MAG: hypothetical protein ACREJ3_15605, partial [Polyangiaceae bacterium]